MKWTLIFFLLTSGFTYGQKHWNVDSIQPPSDFENVYVHNLAQDSLQSVFIIWVKKEVKAHYHQQHTEFIYVISGRAEMKIGDKQLTIRKGDVLQIPKNTPHAVTSIKGKKPLKVISVQAPYFDGTDRVLLKEN